MRFHEIASGLRVPVSGEEQEILNLIGSKGSVARKDMNERGKELARTMVSRGLIQRVRIDGHVNYTCDDPVLRRN